LLNRRPDATERLLAFTETVKAKEKGEVEEDSWRRELWRNASRTHW